MSAYFMKTLNQIQVYSQQAKGQDIFVDIQFDKLVRVSHKQASFQDSLLIIGSFLGTFLTIAKFNRGFVRRKYKNEQAEAVLDYERQLKKSQTF